MLFITAVREDGSISLFPSAIYYASIFMHIIHGLEAGCSLMVSEVCAVCGACTELGVSRSLWA